MRHFVLAALASALITAPAAAQTLGGSSASGRTIDSTPIVDPAPAPTASPAVSTDDALADEAAARVAANGEGSTSVDVKPGQSVAVAAASRCYHEQASWAPVKRGDGYVCENRNTSIGAATAKKPRRRR